MQRTAVIKIGYSQYAIPAEVVALLPQFRKVSHSGLRYYVDDSGSDSIDVEFLCVNDSPPPADDA